MKNKLQLILTLILFAATVAYSQITVPAPIFVRNYQPEWGAWVQDPLQTNGTGKIWAIPGFGNGNYNGFNNYGDGSSKSFVYEYSSMADLLSNTINQIYTLPFSIAGTGHVIYGGNLYFNKYGTNNMVKYNLATQTVLLDVPLTGAGYMNTYHYEWGGFSDIDFETDGTGLWVMYSTSANAGKLVVSKLDSSSLGITATWNTNSEPKTQMGNAFIINGIVYCIDSYTTINQAINYTFNTNTSTGAGASIPWINGSNYMTSCTYNSTTGMLYSWNNGGLYTYQLSPTTPPVAVAATSVSQQSFTANWNTVSGATNYFVDVATDPCFSNILGSYNNISVTANSLSVSGLNASTPYYYYRVRSANASGTSLSSNVITVSTVSTSLGSGGDLWGMTQQGGAGYGVIFKYSPTSGTYTDEYNFDGGSYGNGPVGGLTLAPNGKLYGTAEQGGANGVGVLFSIDPATNIYTKVYDFNGTNGVYPTGRSLTLASNGKLYGTTYQGGNANLGVLFEFDPVAGTYTKDYDFNVTNGNNPYNTLVQAPDGKLYGTTQSGGANGVGVLFQYDPATATFTKKWDFNANGQSPYGGLTVGGDGNLYGMTYAGGTSSYGVLFKFIPCSGEFLAVHNFGGPDGAYGYANVTLAANGKLYGMTYGGGIGYGVLFEYDPTTQTYTNDYNFDVTNGSYPYGSLTQYSDGLLYGMTQQGGSNGLGVLFKFDPVSKIYSKIRDFNGTNGAKPLGAALVVTNSTAPLFPPIASSATSIGQTSFTANWGATTGATGYYLDVSADSTFSSFVTGYQNLSVGNVTMDTVKTNLLTGTTYYYRVRAANANGTSLSSNVISVKTLSNQLGSGGDLWGMTQSGGAGYGVIYKYSPSTGTYTNVYSFDGGANGNSPYAGLALASNGKLYGMTEQGGANNVGVLFEYNPGTGTFAKDFDFGGPNGANPYGGLMQSTNGKLYGMSIYGGPDGYGAIFEFNPATGIYTKVHEFDFTNGAYPFGSLTQGMNGKLYGMTQNGGANSNGVIFEYDPATGTYIKDHDFDLTNGASPRGSLMQATNGKLYGMTYNGGANGSGVLFEYDPGTSTFTKDFDFGGVNGQYPYGRLMQATNGKLYGMTSSGGDNGSGVLFEYDPGTGTFANDFNFGGANGVYPYGSLTQDTNGKLYGVTLQGGANNVGVLFEYDPASSSFTKKLDFNGTNGASPNFEDLVVLGNPQPTIPKVISASSFTATSFQAHWSDSTSVTGYYIDVSTSNTFSSFVPGYQNLSVGNVTSYIVSNLSPATTYFYRLRAANIYGTSGNSYIRAALTLPATPVATAATAVTQNAFTANWSLVAGSSRYYVDVATDSAFSSVLTNWNNLMDSLSNLQVTGLTPGLTYYYRVKSADASGTSPSSNTIRVNTNHSISVNVADSLALVDLYNYTGGGGWNNQNNWTTGPVSMWFGVTLNTPGRVTSLALPSNGLGGTLPNSFLNLTALQTLDLSGNALTQLCPGFASLTSLTSIDIRSNSLQFDALEQVYAMTGLLFNPQNPFGAGTPASIVVGNALNLSVPVGGTANVYQWTLNNNPVLGAVTTPYQFSSSTTSSDAGTYILTVTSSIVTGITLTSNPIYVNIIPVPSAASQTYFSWPGQNGISNDVPSGSYGGYWGDFDNDGDEDLLVNSIVPPQPSRSADLYQNNGNGTFTRLTTANTPTSSGRNYAWADMDNDGYLDIFSTYGFTTPPPSGIYKNNGNKTFSLVAMDSSFFGGSVVDYNNDGLVDVGIVAASAADNSPLVQNLGGDKFRIMSNVFSSATNWVTLWADIDNDNDQDVLFVGDNINNGRSTLYRNDGNGVFTRLSSSIVSTDDLVNVRGASFADIDNDGDMDLFIMSTSGGSSTFYFNDGHGNFTSQLDVSVLGVGVHGRGCAFGDVDNDGDLDLVVDNNLNPNRGTNLFINNGNGTFTFVSSAQQSFIPIQSPATTFVSFADYDNDGFLDLYAGTFDINQPASLYHNVKNSSNWVKFKLKGTVSNSAAIGAKIRIKIGSSLQKREITSQSALCAQNSLIAHFGVGTSTVIDSVIVQWPSGIIQKLIHVSANQELQIIESNVQIPVPPIATAATFVSKSGFTANWNSVPSATNYFVDVAIDAGFSSIIPGYNNLSVASNLLPVVGLTPATTYYYQVRSANTAGSSPSSNSIAVTTTNPVVASDSLALVDFYNNLGGGGWNNQNNWTTGPVSTWFGVTLNTSGRVTALVLPSNGLGGAIPNSFTNLTALDTLKLQQNAITQVPTGFSSMTSLNFIQLKYNNLQFDALEQIYMMPGVMYNPQNNFGNLTTANIATGDAVNLSELVGGSANVYQWALNGMPVSGATTNPFQFSATAAAANAGGYILSVTSTIVTGMTLTSNPITVNIIPLPTAAAKTYFSWPGKNGISNDVPAGSYGSYWGDFNNDGFEDLLVNNDQGTQLAGRAADLYQNNGNGTFTRITTANLPTSAGRNYAWADMDNDGYLDFFSSYGFVGPASSGLYKNNGNKTFTFVSINDSSFFGGSWGDYNNDGLVDLAIAAVNSADNSPLIQNLGSDKFKINSQVFSNATQWATLWSDVDNDNKLDLLFVGDQINIGNSTLYRNNGNGVFTKSPAVFSTGEARGGSWADIDNDGDMDLFIMSTPSGPSMFYFNDGQGNFTAQLDQTVLGTSVHGRACSFGDVDNDGDLDLVVNNQGIGTSLFINNGGGSFSLVSSSNQSFIPVAASNPSVSFVDYDNDGFLDLYAGTYDIEQPAALYHNVKNKNNWIEFKLQGTVSNRAGVGAKVRIKIGSTQQKREISSQTCVQTQNSMVAHFGVGTATTIDSVMIEWPSGIKQMLTGVAVKKKMTVIEPNPAPEYVISPSNGAINTNVSLTITSSVLAGATTYTIEISPDNTFATGVISMSGSRALSFTGLSYSTSYYARVKTNLSSFYGKTTSFTTAAPEYFSYLTAPANAASGVSINPKATSNLVIGATTYTIQISKDNTFASGVISLSGTQSQTFSGLFYNTKYFARVMTDLSPNYGKTTSFTTETAASLCYVTSPANNATGVSYDPTIAVHNLGAMSYTIQLSTVSDFSSIAATQTYNSTSFAFNGLAYSTLYYNRVTCDSANGVWGPVRSFTTGTPATFSYITSPANGATGVNVITNITANAVPDAAVYTIEANTAPDFTGTSIVKMGTVRTYSFQLAFSQTYYVRVQTDLLSGTWGITKSFTTGDPASLAYVVTPANHAANQHLSLNISANNLPGATSYTIQVSSASDFSGNPLSKTSTSRTIGFSGLKNGITYYTRVRTNLASGQWGPSTDFTTVLTGSRVEADTTATEEISDETVLQTFPNPFTKTLTVHLQTLNEVPVSFTLFDLNGKPIREFKGMTNQMLQFDGDELSQGVYILKATSEEFVTVVKVIKK